MPCGILRVAISVGAEPVAFSVTEKRGGVRRICRSAQRFSDLNIEGAGASRRRADLDDAGNQLHRAGIRVRERKGRSSRGALHGSDRGPLRGALREGVRAQNECVQDSGDGACRRTRSCPKGPRAPRNVSTTFETVGVCRRSCGRTSLRPRCSRTA